MDLPEEIISDILTCLPAEQVLDCKFVSKTWRNLIQHPLFSKMHSDRLIKRSVAAAYSTDDSSGKLGFLAFTSRDQLYYFDYIKNHETAKIDRIRRINLTPPFNCKTFLGSFNGLICLRGRKEIYCVYNPMTKEYVILPQPKINFAKHKKRWNGFGYLPSTNEYKVVLMSKVPDFVEVMMYTLGSGNGWRHLGKFKIVMNYVFKGHGIFLNGALHWMHSTGSLILVFDLADETFREHLLLPRPQPSLFRDLGVSDGFLFCGNAGTYYTSNNNWVNDIWLYKKKNENDEHQEQYQSPGWKKEFKLWDGQQPLAFTKSGGYLIYGSNYLYNYNPKDVSSERRVDFDDNEIFRQIFSHKNTFVSLKELGEEGAEIVQAVKTKKRKGRD